MVLTTAIGRAESTTEVRIDGATYLGDLPTLIADKSGHFKRAGLQARVNYNYSGKTNLQRLRKGESDFALMAPTPLVLDQLADSSPLGPEDPVILASLVHSTWFNQVVALRQDPLRQPADLLGQRIGLMKGTNAELIWWQYAVYHGFDPDAVELVDYAIEALPNALAEGQVDAAVLWEPWTSRLTERLGERLHQFSGSNTYTAKWLVVTRRDIARQQPALCRAVLSAYHQAILSIEREPDRAIDSYARHADVRTETLRRNWSALAYDLNLDWTLIATLQHQLDWARRRSQVHASTVPSVLDLIETEHLRAVLPTAVGIPSTVADSDGDTP